VQGGDEGERAIIARPGAGQLLPGLLDRAQRRTAGGCPAARRLDREDREDAVAQELEHVAPQATHRLDDRLEVAIERREEVRFVQPLAQRGEATQVAEQDRRLDVPAIAAPDRPGQHVARRPVAEEGAQQARRRAPHGGGLQRCRERLAQVLDQPEMGIGKAVFAVAHEAHALHRAVAVLERHRQIVGATGSGHLVQHLVVARIEVQETATKGLPPLDHELKGAAVEGIGREHAPRHEIFVRARAALPDDTPSRCQRIREPLPGAQPPERDPEPRQALAEAADQPDRIQGKPGLGNQPPGDRRAFSVMSLVHVFCLPRGAPC
jgi:hypothetical protein